MVHRGAGDGGGALTFQQRLSYWTVNGLGFAHRDAPSTMGADSFTLSGVLSAWPRPRNDGAVGELLRTKSNRGCRLQQSAANKFVASGGTTGNTTLSVTSSTLWNIGSNPAVWHWNLRCDTGNVIARLWKNGVEDTSAVVSNGTNGAVKFDFTEPDWIIGATDAFANLNAAFWQSMMVWNIGTDWSDPTIMAKSYDPVLGLIDPGPTGALVNGSQPCIYLRQLKADDPTGFLANKGSGGDFVMASGRTSMDSTSQVTEQAVSSFIGNATVKHYVQVGLGDSLMDGSLATSFPQDTARYKVSQLCTPARFDLNLGIGGQPLQMQSGDDDGQSIERRGISWLNNVVVPGAIGGALVTVRGAWATATAYAVNDQVTTGGNTFVCLIAHTSGVFATDLAAGKWQLCVYLTQPLAWRQGEQGIAYFPTAIGRFEGGYNDRLNTVANVALAAMHLRDAWTAVTSAPYYFCGAPCGGQRPTPNSVEDDEEYGPSGTVYLQILAINTAIAAYFPNRFFDTRLALIGGVADDGTYTADPYDTTPAADGKPLGALAIASDAGYDITTNATLDAYDVAHGVPGTSLRAVAAITGHVLRQYNIHWNNAGHHAVAVLERRWKAAMGLN